MRRPGLAAGNASPSTATHADNDIEIVDTRIDSDDSVSSLTKKSTDSGRKGPSTFEAQESRPKLEELVSFMEDDVGLTAAKADGGRQSIAQLDNAASGGYANTTVRFETDNSEFNSYDPAIDVIPFGTDTRESSSDVNGSGLLFVFTGKEEGNRVPVGSFGIARTELGGGEHRITSYVLDEGTPTRAEQFEITESEKNLRAQGLVGWAACTSLVGFVCQSGLRVVGQYACVGTCVLIFNANFVAVFGCSSICSTMFNVIATVGCAAGGTVICEEMTERTPGYINFC